MRPTESNPVVRGKCESPRTNPDPQSVSDYSARPDCVKENASDPITSEFPDSPILRPANEKSLRVPSRQRTTFKNPTGYGHGDLRREKHESEGPREGK